VRERVFITGIGCISSFGVGHQAYGDALISGLSGIEPITAFDTSSCRSHRAATVRGFDPTAFMSPLKLRRVDEVGRLTLACARLAASGGPRRSARRAAGMASDADRRPRQHRQYLRNCGAALPVRRLLQQYRAERTRQPVRD
jgi:hypothetical protein